MSVTGQKFFNYGHGIISQNCFAKEYSDVGFEVKLVFTGTFVQVHSIRGDDVLFCIVRDDMQVEMNQMVCKKVDIINVPENLWGPLFTVEKVARLSLVKDNKIAESIGNISVGDTVQVLGPDNSVICIANVTFRNYIERLGVGIYFGLQILSCKGNLPEIIEKVSLLGPGTKGFPRGCDVVVTIDKIRPSNCNIIKEKSMLNHHKECTKIVVKNGSVGEEFNSACLKPTITCSLKGKHNVGYKKDQRAANPDTAEADLNDSRLKKIIKSDNPLNVGDEVIYLEGATPEKGVVRWMGLIENSLKVGVEFENPVGSGTGTVDGLGELFRTKYQHALIVPPMALIKLSDYQMNVSKDTIHLRKKNNYSRNNINQKNIIFNLKANQDYFKNISNGNNNSITNGNNNDNNDNNNNNDDDDDDDDDDNTSKKKNNNYNNSNNYSNNNNNFNSSIESRNINYEHWNLKEFCTDKKQNTEDISKIPQKISFSYQCLHAENIFACNDNFQMPGKDEVFDGTELFKGGHESEGQRNSKSFDFSQPSEMKMGCKRNCNSIDKSLIQKESNFFVNAQNSQILPCWDRFSHEFCNAGRAKPEKSRHNHCCADKKLQKCSDDENDLTYHKSDVISDVINQMSDENLKTFSGKENGELQYLKHSSSNESLGVIAFESLKSSHLGGITREDLGIGSVVEVTFKGEPHYGVIRWIGVLPDEGENATSRLVAGIEMEEECPSFTAGTDGTFNNKRYFQCNPRKALFVPLNKCRKDSRFLEDSQKQNLPSKVNYGQIDCPVVEGIISPINRKGNLESICGKNRGIQGHHNSCYLDATLFSMFAFTSVFDSLLYRPPTQNDICQYSEVQRVLREEIVNPLRKNLYVRADRVMKLRTLLEKLSSVSGLTSEEKDPEEFLNSLLAQILKAEPFLKLNSGQEAFHYQLFVEKDERLVLPSVQQLFEQSFVTSDIKLKQVPSCLIIQMPRFGKSFKMYSRILPPQLLDITDIIENSPRQCTVCGKLAEFECKDCFGQYGIGNGLESISFCKVCLETAHSHHCRSRHNSRTLTVPVEFYELQEHCIIPRLYMELFAVVCIETSHYVAFVKCGSGSDAPWCFFDSMADRKGEQNGYNIPEMVPCPDLPYWLSEEGAKTLNDMRDERQLPEHAKRLFSDAYMCMYQSPELMMYG